MDGWKERKMQGVQERQDDGDEDRKQRKDRIEESKELHKSRREVEKKTGWKLRKEGKKMGLVKEKDMWRKEERITTMAKSNFLSVIIIFLNTVIFHLPFFSIIEKFTFAICTAVGVIAIFNCCCTIIHVTNN